MFEDTEARRSRQKSRGAGVLHAYQVLFAIHCAGFLGLFVTTDGERGAGQAILDLFAVSSSTASGAAPWQLVTYTFLHTHPLELALSVTLLFWLGAAVENALGAAHFTLLYLGSAAATAAGYLVLLGHVPQPAPPYFMGGLAAGGALLCAYVLLEPGRRTLGLIPAPGFFLVGTTVLFSTVVYLDQEQANRLEDLLKRLTGEECNDRLYESLARGTASVPHLLGLLAGTCMFAFDSAVARGVARVRVRREIRVLEEELEARAKVEQLLEKISREGLGALSRRERKFLQYASRFYPNGPRHVMSD
ncbi:rhomboid family intramembrane serine protease [bacterium]|nr:rhomboid family intramembrane serine protease [bacterium]